MIFFDAALDWLANGLLAASWWQVVLYTLVTTHITIASVTIFLHRHQAHRAMDLHAIPSHFFRFWLWLGTGQVTKEWVAIHRKHHAKCETVEDPHSPQAHGIKTVLWRGAEMYRAESQEQGNHDQVRPRHAGRLGRTQPVHPLQLARRGPDADHQPGAVRRGGPGGLGCADGLDPVTAAGIINGIGHYWGYRNFEAPDASTNISPWGIMIGGEELHNNHHTYPTSAKFSVKPYEFDIGWFYIRALRKVGLATSRRCRRSCNWAPSSRWPTRRRWKRSSPTATK
jgi:stearoyl-CoA desaturase (delta-9 desaturase)